MHIYQFTIKEQVSDIPDTSDWIRSCYRKFKKSDIDELLILRHNDLIEIFAVGLNSKNIIKSLNGYFTKKLNISLDFAEISRVNQDALIYFFEIIIGKNEGLPSDPRILSQMREEFNLALDEGSVGSILTKMYRQGENIGNTIQNDPIILKNCIARPEVVLDISKKIAGSLEDFQFLFIGNVNSDMVEIINTIKNTGSQKKYIYHDDFSKAYQAGLDLGCIPINKVQLENQFEHNTIFIDFDKSVKNTLNLIIPIVKKNKNYLYIYFDLSKNKPGNITSYPPNLYVQTHEQLEGLIENHITNRSEYLKTVDHLLDSEIRSFYAWLYSDERYVFHGIVSADRRMQKVFELLRRIAPSEISVLISGETGTGKELIAKAIHQNSNRSNSNFVAVNCSAIPETLLEGELFGYEKGSFTGAITAKKGLIEIASGGTLFLDEIGDLPPMIQVKLLRVLQEREILRIGNTKPLKVDIRLITATNHDLNKLTNDGNFRSDLYYRVNTVQINLPALRERRDDIPILTNYFIKRLNRKNGKQINRITDEVYNSFITYDWPGNIRELENIIERAFAVSIGEEITLTDLPTRLQSFPTQKHSSDKGTISVNRSLKDLEAERIKELLFIKRTSLSDTAKILGIGRTTLWRKMREFGISKDEIV